MMKLKPAYIGAVFAIAFGVVLLWFPPSSMAGQAATVGTALAFITGGLAAFGVTVTIPHIAKTAEDTGYIRGYMDKTNGKQSRI